MPNCFVDPSAPSDPKFMAVAEFLGIERFAAFGLAVSLWCLCWRKEYFDGKLNRYTAQGLADELLWKGDAKKLVEALLVAEVLTQEGGKLVAKNFSERQGPLIRKLLADRTKSEEKSQTKAATEGAKRETAKAGDDTVVKTMLDLMSANSVTGKAEHKREHIQAWRASKAIEKAQSLIAGEGRGKSVYWITKVLDGPTPPAAGQSNGDSVSKMREHFLGGGK